MKARNHTEVRTQRDRGLVITAGEEKKSEEEKVKINGKEVPIKSLYSDYVDMFSGIKSSTEELNSVISGNATSPRSDSYDFGFKKVPSVSEEKPLSIGSYETKRPSIPTIAMEYKPKGPDLSDVSRTKATDRTGPAKREDVVASIYE